MAGLTGTQLKNTYGDLLYLNNSNAGNSASLLNALDGLGAASGFWVSTTQIGVGSTGDNGFKRAAAGVIATTNGGSGLGWLQISSGRARLTADVTNTGTTFAALSDLSITLVAGRKYVGKLVVKCNDDQATEGMKFDFNGGTATMTSFWAAMGGLTGSPTIGTAISTSLAGTITVTGATGEQVLVFEISMVANAGGTFIVRQAKNATGLGGTLTCELGSFIMLEDSPN